ncbi:MULTISPECIES: N-acetylglucosamine-6-phosphate deacetylase [unclassified Deinococcus]|uniref:N-acetylglucosamine-6-phosphate deacetylase n=1 Tax=unclassified Deinococcus TaxID=2623546 RepID=UPI001C304F5D|nr:N-acetylglucosamine-6-phosphate deacetylase [Deinococcus sp. 43]MDK2012038.1 N-acetylglucosamine-6-phosphate deacetylase [Deinococcus sp. 43]
MTSTEPTVLRGQLLLPGGLAPGALHVHDGRITAVVPDPTAPTDRLILPGFVDTHVHGGGGGDTMDGREGLIRLARLHARHGTTTLLPTTITNPWDRILDALRAVADLRRQGVPGGADLPGAHLEGPFISPQRLGAQPPFTLDPTPDRLDEVLKLDVVRAVTLAPELPGATAAALRFARAGIRVGVGHTRADADTVSGLLAAVHASGGQAAATHLFNAMGGVEGRAPGPAGALMSDPLTTLEIILDGVHVHDTAFRLACAAAPDRVMLITDAMRAAGLGDGQSELGGQPVTVRGPLATLPDGTLAGSVLTMDAALRRAVAAGIPLPQASRMASLTPARSVGLHDRGELRVGLRADLVALNAALEVQDTWVSGHHVTQVEDVSRPSGSPDPV